MTLRTYRIETLGCKANLYDSQRLAEALEALGLRRSDDGAPTDVCVLNTCTVTAVADRKGRQLAARLARRNPGARLFVTGCGAATDRERLAAVEGVEAVFGREGWDGLLRALGGPEAAEGTGCSLSAGGFGIRSFAGRARAFLKVQEGCDAACSYCILPRVRGAPHSRPLDDAVAEAGRLVEAGFAELVLTGIHLGLYARDLPGGEGLAGLVRAVAAVPGLGRLRLSSVEAAEVDEELLDAMRHPAVCSHLHIPLQSGDADVLRRMNRRYGPEEFLRAVELARARLDRPALTTDVIVGFPGETDAAFENTAALCRAARFSRMHVFPFSPRPDTPAARMDGRVPPGAVRERARRARELGRELAAEWARGFVGGQERVLFEERTPSGLLAGYTDRYVRLSAPGPADQVGRVVQVMCTARCGGALRGRLAASCH